MSSDEAYEGKSERYELSDFFAGFPEITTAHKAAAVVIALALLGLVVLIPFVFF